MLAIIAYYLLIGALIGGLCTAVDGPFWFRLSTRVLVALTWPLALAVGGRSG
jgi:hypothetical protein